jgi:hypothetical protein
MNATTTPSDMTIMDTIDTATPEKKSERKPKKVNYRQLKKQPKIGRNEDCPCGSGQKYKMCCLVRQEEYYVKQSEIKKQVDDLLEKTSQTDIEKQVKAIVDKPVEK